jgi:anti-anti-sigma factor
MEFKHVKKEFVIYTLKGRFLGEQDGAGLLESIGEKIEEGEKFFILDLSELQHINSVGLGVFTNLLTKIRKVEGEICLLRLTSTVGNIFSITKLNSVFKVCDTLEEAVLCFN